MKKIRYLKTSFFFIALALIVSLLVNFTPKIVAAEDAGDSSSQVISAETNEIVQASEESVADYFGRFWSRIKAMTTVSSSGSNRTTAVAGLRGAEQDSDELSPYWKGDVPQSTAPDQVAFTAIGELIEKNDFAAAEEALMGFRQTHDKSPLRPHAEMTLAICQMQQGHKSSAKATLDGFLKEYGDHDLAPQAKAMMAMIDSLPEKAADKKAGK